MSNFAFLQDEFQELAQAAQGAEQFVYDYPKGAVMCTRQALESLVWWMYQYDKTLIEPYEPSLFNLLDTPEFLKLVPEHVRMKMDVLRRSEPPRVSRRPNFLREYPNEKYLLT